MFPYFRAVHFHRCVANHSLTHSLLRLTSEGRNDLHNERSCADDHNETEPVILFHLLYPGLPWPTRWTLPVGTGHLPCERLTQCWRILWAGTSGGRQQTCPSKHTLN